MNGSPGRAAGDDGLDGAVARIGRSARQRNLARADRVLELLVRRRGPLGATDRSEAARLCHAIAGSAGTFGDDELADAARHVEAALRDGRPDRVAPARDVLHETVRVLRR
ncbi:MULTISPECIES: Hpt domain-containing protein [Isoptericola]|uniref:Hpt domain-containing protein n=1 Tax=Isoptericola TaxID=254250 RepID=UPI00383BCB6E